MVLANTAGGDDEWNAVMAEAAALAEGVCAASAIERQTCRGICFAYICVRACVCVCDRGEHDSLDAAVAMSVWELEQGASLLCPRCAAAVAERNGATAAVMFQH